MHGLLLAALPPWNVQEQKADPGAAAPGRLRGMNMTDEQLRTLTQNQLRALYNSAPDYLRSLLDRKRALEEGIVWELSIPQRGGSGTRHAR